MSQVICCGPSVVHLGAPWWRRAATWVHDGVGRLSALAESAGAGWRGQPEPLAELHAASPRLLRDIGAPEVMVERARHAASRAGAVPPTWM